MSLVQGSINTDTWGLVLFLDIGKSIGGQFRCYLNFGEYFKKKKKKDKETWRAEIHGVAKSRTRLSDWTELKKKKKRKVLFPSHVCLGHILIPLHGGRHIPKRTSQVDFYRNWNQELKHLCCCLVIQSSLTLWEPMDCRPPGSFVHGILQARMLGWVAIFFSRGSSRPRDEACVSCIARWILYQWAT